MTTAPNSLGGAGQYCAFDTTVQAASHADTHNEDECPLTLLLLSSLHIDGPLFDEAAPATGVLQRG